MAAMLADDILKCISLNENDNSDLIFTETGSQESKWQSTSIGLGNGLSLPRGQAITLTNAQSIMTDEYMRHKVQMS